MRKNIASVALLLMLCCILAGCFPPFIDGAIEAKEYFSEEVKCLVYATNPSAEGGIELTANKKLSLAKLTDGDEGNIPFDKYFSFTFSSLPGVEFELNGIVFIIQAENDASLSFALFDSRPELIKRKTIQANNQKIIVEFTDLALPIMEHSTITLTLENPLSSNTSYYIDSLVFLVGEKNV